MRAIQSEKTPLLSMRGTTIEPLLRSLLRKSLVEGRLDHDVQERVISPAYFVRSRLGPDGEQVTGVDEALDLLVRTTIPLFLGILLLTALLSASGYLVQTVSTDKESKIVEVLLSSVTPEEILAGKLFGLGAAGLLQFAVWSSMVVFVALTASAALAAVVSIPWQALAVAPLLFILGYAVDWKGIVFIMVPIMTPIAHALEFDPVWFALMVCINLQMSFMTPPFAPAMFYLKASADPSLGVKMGHIMRGVAPFVGMVMLGLLLCTVFPQIILWLPSMMLR